MSSPKGIFWVLLASGVTSGVAVYMLATKNGRALKRDLKKKKDMLINKTNEVLKEGKEKTKTFLKEAKKHGEELSKEISKVPENYLVPAKKKVRNSKRPY